MELLPHEPQPSVLVGLKPLESAGFAANTPGWFTTTRLTGSSTPTYSAFFLSFVWMLAE